MSDWNTELYLLFEDGRNKPIYDLISHIHIQNPKRIIDIGCGAGNSTVPLKKMFTSSEIIGIDNSPGMIEKARQIDMDITWVLRNANEDISDLGTFDIVFSNSALHWLPDHIAFFPRLFKLLNSNGVIAVQIPYFFGTPIYKPLYSLVESDKWDRYFPIKQPTTYHDVGFYYDLLSSHFSVFDIWTTKHTHVLNSKEDIMKWYMPTGFKAFTDQLRSEEMTKEFLSDISRIIDDLYMPRKNGKYLLIFERLFFAAQQDKLV